MSSAFDDLVQQFVQAAGLQSAALSGEGLEFAVYRGQSPGRRGEVALRIPKAAVIENVNDPWVETRALMEQELEIYRYLQAGPLPVPTPLGLVHAGNRSAMLSEFVHSDDSQPSDEELGRIMALLHRLDPPEGLVSVAQEGIDTLALLPRRIARRWAEVKKFHPSLPPLPATDKLGEIASRLSRFPMRLLHLDLRAANLRVREGKVMAVCDWSNTLIGPAALDVLRTAELGRPGPDFYAAYSDGAHANLASHFGLAPPEEALLRLDAAVMICLVWLSESPDGEKAVAAIERLEELVGELATSQR